MAVDFIRSIFQQANSSGTRSTALSDLRWLIAILMAAFVGALKYQAPTWALQVLAVFIGVCIVVYLGIYIFFSRKNPDALRSEKYTLSKMAIERSMTGDNLIGLIDPPVGSRALIPEQSVPKKEGE